MNGSRLSEEWLCEYAVKNETERYCGIQFSGGTTRLISRVVVQTCNPTNNGGVFPFLHILVSICISISLFITEGSQGRNPEAGAEAEVMEECYLLAPHDLPSLLFYRIHDHS